jgi:NAD(P)-dependent dehydrogenase (short-subunit alcohol dehydrogenase family)
MAFEAARILGAAGRPLVLADLEADRAAAAAASLRSEGLAAVGRGVDSRDGEAVRALAAEVSGQGPVEVVVTAVGGSAGTPRWIDAIGPDDVQAVIDLCVASALNAAEAFADALRASGGSLVFVSSSAARLGDRVGWSPVYAYGKGAVLGLARWIACDPAWFGVRANAVCPGDVLTERTLEIFADGGWTEEEQDVILHRRNSLGRIATPEELGRSIAAIALDTFANGVVLDASGGEYPTPV